VLSTYDPTVVVIIDYDYFKAMRTSVQLSCVSHDPNFRRWRSPRTLLVGETAILHKSSLMRRRLKARKGCSIFFAARELLVRKLVVAQ